MLSSRRNIVAARRRNSLQRHAEIIVESTAGSGEQARDILCLTARGLLRLGYAASSSATTNQLIASLVQRSRTCFAARKQGVEWPHWPHASADAIVGRAHLFNDAGSELGWMFSTFERDQWLFIVTSGEFDGTEDMIHAFHVRVPGTLDLVPLEQFREEYYHQGLLKDLKLN